LDQDRSSSDIVQVDPHLVKAAKRQRTDIEEDEDRQEQFHSILRENLWDEEAALAREMWG